MLFICFLILHAVFNKMKKIQLFALLTILFASAIACKKDQVTVTGVYFPKVKTIIQNNCLSCHSSSGTWAGRPTKFDTDDQIAAVYAAIKASVADPITITNKRMPQGGSLSASDVDIIVQWYNKGGKTTD